MNDEYTLLNNIEVDLSQYKIEEVDEVEKNRLMKNFKKANNKKTFWNKKKIGVAAALFLAINLGLNGEQVLAAAQDFRNSIVSWLGIESSGEKYVEKIGETLNINGKEITLNEFFTDNSRIIINFNINEGVNDAYSKRLTLIPDIYVNGKKVERSSDYVGVSVGAADEKNTHSNVILEVNTEKLSVSNKEEVKLVFSSLAKDIGATNEELTYSFSYDSSSYNKDSKVIDVEKAITSGENKLSINNVIVTPDRVVISGESKGFSLWENANNIDCFYDVLDENNEVLPLKEEIGKGAYFYKGDRDISTLKIVPYSFDKSDTNITGISSDGRTKYIMEDDILTISLR